MGFLGGGFGLGEVVGEGDDGGFSCCRWWWWCG